MSTYVSPLEEEMVGPQDPTTGAELRSIRDALGLPLDWVAHHTGVRPDALRQWEAERKSKRAPAAVARRLWALLEEQEDFVDREVDRLLEAGPDRVTLLRFRGDADVASHGLNLPATAHGIAQLRIARELETDGVITRMIWFNPAEYERWLDQQPADLSDTPETRQTWAESIPWETPPH